MERTARGRRSRFVGLLAGVVGSLFGLDIDGHGSEIKSDEHVVFFPTTARLSDDGSRWIVRIHGWILEPETDSRLRAGALRQVRRILNRDLGFQMRLTTCGSFESKAKDSFGCWTIRWRGNPK